ncbi:hypothetical protein WJX72_010695 [[Myrmecia] bisecta]|uniref:Flagellar associated protein n=1 Tax=[Myrmecia] bisecta TaxID=41462 RepID=A0AAW1QGA3_9CHLO
MVGTRILTPKKKPETPASRPSTSWGYSNQAGATIGGLNGRLGQTPADTRQDRYRGRGEEEQQRPSTAPTPSPSKSAVRRAEAYWFDGNSAALPFYRQKGGKQPAPGDAAGLLGGSRYHGRNTPVKGKGHPPPENKEEVRLGHKTWHPMHSHLLKRRDIFGQQDFAGLERGKEHPSKRVFSEPLAKSYHLHGAGVSIDAPEDAWRKSRGWGVRPLSARVNTAERTMGTSAGLTEDDVDPLDKPRHTFMRRVDPNRPMDHSDILRYRHSNGICAEVYKLDGRRTAAPQCTPKIAEFSSKSYFDSHSSYQMNRARAEGVTDIMVHHQ